MFIREASPRPLAREERIRDRAHALWEREGRPEGRSEEHWAQASREIEREEQVAKTGTAGSPNNVTSGEPAPKYVTRIPASHGAYTWAMIGVVALLLMANVFKRIGR